MLDLFATESTLVKKPFGLSYYNTSLVSVLLIVALPFYSRKGNTRLRDLAVIPYTPRDHLQIFHIDIFYTAVCVIIVSFVVAIVVVSGSGGVGSGMVVVDC